jgi:hypothetical protein
MINLPKVSRVVELKKRIDLQLLNFGKIDNYSLDMMVELMGTLTDEESKKVDEIYIKETHPLKPNP